MNSVEREVTWGWMSGFSRLPGERGNHWFSFACAKLRCQVRSWLSGIQGEAEL